MTSQLEQFLSSELSRNSANVFKAAEKGPVLVTRRDGENLVLMSQREADMSRDLFDFAAQLILITTATHGTLVERMSDQFHWMLALSHEEREDCAQELIASARAAFATNQPNMFVTNLRSWKETATALASGLHETQVEMLERPERVTEF
jgi:hypothetical protein